MALCSCSDFLKSEDKDQVIPKTVEQYSAMLHQHGFLNVTWFYRSDFMTDDITENAETSTEAKNEFKGLYTWAKDIERDGDGNMVSTNQMWESLYNDILVANYVIERAPEAEGTESELNQIMGEAYFLHARALLELVNIYAKPYDPATAQNTPGIPLREGTGALNTYSRASVADVYARIISDLQNSISRFGASDEKVSLWHPNHKAALLLLTRTYLYMGDWQKVVSTATELISKCPAGLYNMAKQVGTPVVTEANPEILHCYGSCTKLMGITSDDGSSSFDVPTTYLVSGTSNLATYGASESLLSSFLPGDCRADVSVIASSSIAVPAKWHGNYTKYGAYSYRLSEAYLSRAEAQAALGNTQEALADVRKVIENRVYNINNVRMPSASEGDYPTVLRRFIIDERRREFCFENHRWFDLRRTASWYPVTLTHVFSNVASAGGNTGTVQGTETYTLEPGSPNYTLEIPFSEQGIIPTLMYNGRVEILPVKENSQAE